MDASQIVTCSPAEGAQMFSGGRVCYGGAPAAAKGLLKF